MKKSANTIVVILVVSITIYTYIVTKAWVSSFTHDESFSYLHFISQKFMDIISNQGAYSNNHVLNTLGMKYSDLLFGNSEISLRLPNLIMLLAYFIYTFLLLNKAQPVLCISMFVLMTTNTPLIDFFGLARGYGMSIGFMIMSLYHLVASFTRPGNRHLVLFNIGALLAILSNFTMLGYYLSALLVFNLVSITECRCILKEKFNFYRTNKVNIFLFFVLLIILYEPVRKAVKFNTFNFGGKQGFITDTVTSLVYHMFMNIQLNSVEIALLQIFILLTMLSSFVIILIKLYRSDVAFLIHFRGFIFVNFITLSISLETIVQHYILKTDYLVGRFSLFLVPLFLLNTAFLFEYSRKVRVRYLVTGLAVSLAILSISNFYRNCNLYSCAEWGYDMETKNMVRALILDQNKGDSKKSNIKLGINWVFEPTINFYRQTWNLTWFMPVDRNGLTDMDDYDYIFRTDLSTLKNCNHEVVFSSDGTNTVLIRNSGRVFTNP